jgi:RNA polymerase sigma factor FliA
MNRLNAIQGVSNPGVSRAQRIGQGKAHESDARELWEAYWVSRDESIRNRLLLHYLPLSQVIARHMHSRMPGSVELDDLAQAAVLGMRSALSTYDPSRGIPFENFCGPRVRGAILDHLRSLDWAPRMLRSRVARVREMIRQMEMSTGASPTDEQLSSALNMPMDELREVKGEMVPPPVRICNGGEGESDHAVNLDLLADGHADDPLIEAQRADLREFLARGLSSVEQRVIVLYYYDNLSLREIGEALMLSESRVSQIHHATIRRLQERMHRIGGTSVEE